MSICPTTRHNSKPILVLVPKNLLAAVDTAVRLGDTDRAKWIRAAVREKLRAVGLDTEADPRASAERN